MAHQPRGRRYRRWTLATLAHVNRLAPGGGPYHLADGPQAPRPAVPPVDACHERNKHLDKEGPSLELPAPQADAAATKVGASSGSTARRPHGHGQSVTRARCNICLPSTQTHTHRHSHSHATQPHSHAATHLCPLSATTYLIHSLWNLVARRQRRGLHQGAQAPIPDRHSGGSTFGRSMGDPRTKTPSVVRAAVAGRGLDGMLGTHLRTSACRRQRPALGAPRRFWCRQSTVTAPWKAPVRDTGKLKLRNIVARRWKTRR